VKCVTYGVACDFEGNEGGLDVHVKGVGRVEFEEGVVSLEIPLLTTTADYGTSDATRAPWNPISINGVVTSMIGDSLRSATSELGSRMGIGHAPWEFLESHLEILMRFQSRTSLTVGGMILHCSILIQQSG